MGHFRLHWSFYFKARLNAKSCYEYQFSFMLKLELITARKILHLVSLFERATEGNAEMAYWFMVSVRLFNYVSTQEVGKRKRSVRAISSLSSIFLAFTFLSFFLLDGEG